MRRRALVTVAREGGTKKEVGAPAAVVLVAPLTCCMRAALSIMVASLEQL